MTNGSEAQGSLPFFFKNLIVCVDFINRCILNLYPYLDVSKLYE